MALTVQLVSPERVLWEGEAQIVVARTIGGGDVAFEPGHAPFLGALQTWPVFVRDESGNETRIASHGGFVQVDNDRVIILSDIAELGGDIDVDRAKAALAGAESALAADADDANAAAARQRARVRLEVAGA